MELFYLNGAHIYIDIYKWKRNQKGRNVSVVIIQDLRLR
jgi:hypothetical protein